MTSYRTLISSIVLLSKVNQFLSVVLLRVIHVGISVIFNDRYDTYRKRLHCYAFATLRPGTLE